MTTFRWNGKTLSAIATFLTPAIIVLIVLLSFRSFAAYLAPDYNAGNAIHILMAYDLKLPEDLYFWGQDRLGSLLPILTHGVLQIVPLSPVVAISFVQYFLLLVGFCCFAALFRYPLSRVIFALAWFLPGAIYLSILKTGQPYGPQLMLIAIGTLLIDRLCEDAKTLKQLKRQGLLAIATACLFLSLWMSDFSIITIGLFAGMAGWHTFRFIARQTHGQRRSAIALVALDTLTIALVTALGFWFITYAKNNAAVRRDYSVFNSFDEILTGLGILRDRFIETISFQGISAFIGLSAIGLLLFVGYIGYVFNASARHQQIERFSPSRWFYFFLINTLLGLVVLILSHSVYQNGLSTRYFTFTHITGWLTVIFLAEGLEKRAARVALTILSLSMLCFSLSMPSYVFSIAKAQPLVERLGGLRSLGQAGLIGDVRSYILCTVDPASLTCITHDRTRGGAPRCDRCISRVFDAPTIYLIKGKWLNPVPDQVEQYGRTLVKAGDTQQIGEYTLIPYRQR